MAKDVFSTISGRIVFIIINSFRVYHINTVNNGVDLPTFEMIFPLISIFNAPFSK